MEFVISFLVCIIATVLGAATGSGGGVIIKPVLDATSSMSVATISFLSSCTVLAMSIVSLLKSKSDKSAKIDKKRGTFLAVGAAVGGILGKFIFVAIKTASGNDALVGIIQNALLFSLTAGVFFYVINKKRINTLDIQNQLACIAIGLLLGIFSAFLGIGGGPINLVVLLYFFSMDTKNAALNSIYLILFSQATGIISTIFSGLPEFSILMLILMAIGGVAGGVIGRIIAKKIDNSRMDMLFIAILIFIIAICAYNVVVLCF